MTESNVEPNISFGALRSSEAGITTQQKIDILRLASVLGTHSDNMHTDIEKTKSNYKELVELITPITS